MFIKDANSIILVYDVTCKNSFEELQNFWIEEIKQNCNEEPILAIAENNSEQFENEAVDEEQARHLADEIGAIFACTSTIDSINSLFLEIVKKYTGSENNRILNDNDGRLYRTRKGKKEFALRSLMKYQKF